MSIEIFRVLLILFRMKWRKRQRIQWEKNARVTLEIHVCIFVCDSNEQQSEKKWHKNELNDVKQWKEKKKSLKNRSIKNKKTFSKKKQKLYIYMYIYRSRARCHIVELLAMDVCVRVYECVCARTLCVRVH